MKPNGVHDLDFWFDRLSSEIQINLICYRLKIKKNIVLFIYYIDYFVIYLLYRLFLNLLNSLHDKATHIKFNFTIDLDKKLSYINLILIY